jgi:TP901 family phage tail tape measure protein
MAFETVEVELTANLDKLNNGLKQADGKFSSFGANAQKAIGGITKAAAALGAAVLAASVVASKAFGTFESAISDVRRQLQDVGRGEELEAMTEGVQNLAEVTGRSSTEIADSLQNVINAQTAVGDELAAVEKIQKLAIATGTDLATTTRAVNSAMLQYGESAGSVENVVDVLFETTLGGVISINQLDGTFKKVGQTAAGAGVSFEEMSGAMAFLTSKGVDARQAQQLFLQVIEGTTKGSAIYSDALKKAELATDGSALATEGLLGVLTKLGTLEGEQFGQLITSAKAREQLKLITEDQIGFENALLKVRESAGSVEAEFAERQGELNELTLQLGQSIKQLSIDAIEPLIPTIKSVVERMIEAVQTTREWINENPQFEETMFAVVDTVKTLANGVKFLARGIQDSIPAIAEWTNNFIKFVPGLDTVVKGLRFLINNIKGVVVETINIVESMQDEEEAMKAVNLIVDESIEKLKTKAERTRDLTDAEQKEIDQIEDTVDALQDELNLLIRNGEGMGERAEQIRRLLLIQTQYAEAVMKGIDDVRGETEAVKENTQAKKDQGEVLSVIEIQQLEEQARIDDVKTKYKELALAYQDAEIDQKAFAEGVKGLVGELVDITGSADKAIKILEQFNKEELSLDVEVRIAGDKELLAIKERIIDTQNEILLNNLDGEARAIKVAELNHEKRMRFIEFEREASQKRMEARIAEEEALLKATIKNQDLLATAQGKSAEEIVEIATARRDAEVDIQKEIFKASQELFDEEIEEHKKLTDQIIADIIKRGVAEGELSTEQKERIKDLEDEVRLKQKLADLATGQATEFGSIAEAINAPFVLGSRSVVKGAFQGGIDSVPTDGLFQLHRGERVVASGQGVVDDRTKGQTTIINLIDKAMIPQIMAEFPEAVVNMISTDILNNGVSRRVIKSVG